MKVMLTGATGFVGSRLAPMLEEAGHTLVRVSRGPSGDVDWDPERLASAVAGVDAIVHLAGENIFARRWSSKQKQVLRSSRIETTRRLAELAAGAERPRCLLCASAIGYYGPSEVQGLDEGALAGADFLAQLCIEWEAATQPASEAGVRTAVVRVGVVLGTGGGALKKMLLPFKLGLGGPLGSGSQWVSWIHIDDLAALFKHLLEHGSASGAFNATAPRPVNMKTLARTLGRVLGRPAVLPAPGFAMRLALGEVADVLLTGQHVVPARSAEVGFEFRHPELEAALRDLLG